MPPSIQERQPVERFMSTFMRKTDSMLIEAKHHWSSDPHHKKHFGKFSERLIEMDETLKRQLTGRLTTDDLQILIGTITAGNSQEKFIVEAILNSLRGNLVYHLGPKQTLPHSNVYASPFDDIYIVEEKTRVKGHIPTEDHTNSAFSIVGRNHIPQEYMEQMLKKK